MMSNTKNYEQGFPGGFTVLMAVYEKDDSELFAKAIASVYGNELKPDHMVLVVDGPVPTQLEHQILSAEQQHGTEVVRLDTTLGLAEALNAGLEHINTEWVVRAGAVKDFKGGIIAESKNKVVSAINKLLDDKSKRKKLSEDGYRFCTENCMWDKIICEYEEVFRG